MADKIPVIVDNRGDNTVLQALQKLAPNLEKMDIATGVFEIGSFLLPEVLRQDAITTRVLYETNPFSR